MASTSSGEMRRVQVGRRKPAASQFVPSVTATLKANSPAEIQGSIWIPSMSRLLAPYSQLPHLPVCLQRSHDHCIGDRISGLINHGNIHNLRVQVQSCPAPMGNPCCPLPWYYVKF